MEYINGDVYQGGFSEANICGNGSYTFADGGY